MDLDSLQSKIVEQIKFWKDVDPSYQPFEKKQKNGTENDSKNGKQRMILVGIRGKRYQAKSKSTRRKQCKLRLRKRPTSPSSTHTLRSSRQQSRMHPQSTHYSHSTTRILIDAIFTPVTLTDFFSAKESITS